MPKQTPVVDPYASIAQPIASGDPYAGIAQPVDPNAQFKAPGAFLDPAYANQVSQTAVTSPENEKPGMVQSWIDNNLSRDQPNSYESPVANGVENFGRGFSRTALQTFLHPVDTAAAALESIGNGYNSTQAPGWGKEAASSTPQGRAMAAVLDQGQDAVSHPMDTLGGAAAQTLLGKGLGLAGEGPEMWDNIQDWAKGDPNEAALKGLGVSAKSPMGLATLENIDKARPFLKAAGSRLDLQSRIPGAKAEIWDPMKSTIDQIGDKQITGPDGPTTVRDLEALRKQTSAQLDSLRSKDPVAIQTAIQKGLSEADLSAYYKRILGALDPHLQAAGIDPAGIRDTYGAVKGIEKQVAGRTTLPEKPQPFGVGRMTNLKLNNPYTWFGEPAQGARDIVAGRPLWSGKPTDINIREGFRIAGPKPDFRSPVRPSYMKPPLKIEANVPGNAGYGEELPPGGLAGRPPITTPAPKNLYGLPAAVGDSEVRPMIGVLKNQHPGAAVDFSRERVDPTIFKPPLQVPQTPAGFTVAPDGTVVRVPRGLLEAPKAAIRRKSLYRD